MSTYLDTDMNTSSTILSFNNYDHIAAQPTQMQIPNLEWAPYILLATQLRFLIAILVLACAWMYLANYTLLLRKQVLHTLFTGLSIGTFVLAHFVAKVDCSPFQSLAYFPISIGVMKVLDMYMRRNSPPVYIAHPDLNIPVPTKAYQALLMTIELRYESFTPNAIHKPLDSTEFSERNQWLLHVFVFIVLEQFPQYPTVVAFEVLLSVYIIWTAGNLVLKYKGSRPLFRPLWTADSLAGFWADTWHNVFTSPCHSIAYSPIRYTLPKIGVPSTIARGMGVIGAFGLMAAFHVYAINPVLSTAGAYRIAIFFLLNGVACATEVAIWGMKKNWMRKMFAWTFEIIIATWAVREIGIPQEGLSGIAWKGLCSVRDV